MIQYEDRTLECQDCGKGFTFTADDQSYHASKGFTNEPKRCQPCRELRRNDRGGGGFGQGQGRREMHPVVCGECGKDTTVPFQPRGDRPVYCSDCFSRQPRSSSSGSSGSSGRGRW